jgi:MFS family permease
MSADDRLTLDGPGGNGAEPATAGDGAATDGHHPEAGRWSRWRLRTTGGAPLFPLGVLFGLNMADELDRTAFGVLLPEIRDHFGLDTNGILWVVSLSLVGAIILALPIGFYADRLRRVPIVIGGASVWGVFSMLTGLANNLWTLGIARAGSGLSMIPSTTR